MKSPKVILWGAWYGSHNVGDQALLLSIMDLLSAKIPDAQFVVLTDNRKHVERYTRLESSQHVTVLQNRRQFPLIIKAIADAELFVFGGGVPFFDQRYHLAVMGTLVLVARIFKTPYMTWSVSSQQINRPEAKKLFRWVLQGASAITYRDKQTGELFEKCNVYRSMLLVADPVFTLDQRRNHNVDVLLARAGATGVTRPLVALTPRVLRGPDNEAETHYNPKTPKQYRQEVLCYATANDWLWTHGYQPIFVPMNTVSPDDDREAAKAVLACAEYAEHALLIDEEVRPRLAPSVFDRCCFAFVSRVHGSVTAMLGNCPVIMYAFDQKHSGIMESMNLAQYAIREENGGPETVTTLLETMTDNLQNIKNNMRSTLARLQQDAAIPADIAAKIISGA